MAFPDLALKLPELLFERVAKGTPYWYKQLESKRSAESAWLALSVCSEGLKDDKYKQEYIVDNMIK